MIPTTFPGVNASKAEDPMVRARPMIAAAFVCLCATASAAQGPRKPDLDARELLRLEDRVKKATGSSLSRYRFTDTWVKRRGKWQIVAAHDYLVPPKR